MNTKLVLAEVILLIASVFIFRSLWLLLDTQPLMHQPGVLWISLAIALAVTIPSLRYIIKRST